MFYDADVFIDWGRRLRAAGITIPIVPGIMPIQTFAAFKRRTDFAGTIVPQELWDLLEPIKDDDAKVREAGTQYVADMCRKILDADLGIHGLHCYTMNLSRGTEMLLERMHFVPTADRVKPLPWRVSLTQKRRTETTRPIFWSNRQRSYLVRTRDWDEFPNGRWGDASSPAFGDVDALLAALPIKAQDAIDLWGKPATLGEVAALFARFCRGDLKRLPWSDQPAAKETSRIAEQLARINELGFLTVSEVGGFPERASPLLQVRRADTPTLRTPPTQINSQPRVDGAKSQDPAFGWGPINGYVYQKVGRSPGGNGSDRMLTLPTSGLPRVLLPASARRGASRDPEREPVDHVPRRQQARRLPLEHGSRPERRHVGLFPGRRGDPADGGRLGGVPGVEGRGVRAWVAVGAAVPGDFARDANAHSQGV